MVLLLRSCVAVCKGLPVCSHSLMWLSLEGGSEAGLHLVCGGWAWCGGAGCDQVRRHRGLAAAAPTAHHSMHKRWCCSLRHRKCMLPVLGQTGASAVLGADPAIVCD